MAKKSVIDEIAENIVKQLEDGTAPWVKPWDAPQARPFNPISGTKYKGVNFMHLSSKAASDPRWMTYKQAQSVDAQVRKGEKSTGIIFWKFYEQLTVRGEDGKPKKDEHGQTITVRGEKLSRPIMMSARVFNADQIDGLPPLPELDREPMPRIEQAEAVLISSGASIDHNGGDRAFYRPSTDSIHLPKPETFKNSGRYYSTALHELGHWTGHESRLNRDLTGGFGSEKYAEEELRAEIYSYMMSADLELPHDPSQHVAYIGSWIKAIKEDPMTIHRACRDAGNILSYVNGLVQENSIDQSPENEKTIESQQADLAVQSLLEGSREIGGIAMSADEQKSYSALVAKGLSNTSPELPNETVAISDQVMSLEQERVFRDAIEKGEPIDEAHTKAIKTAITPKRAENVQRRELPTMKVDPEAEFTQAVKDMGLVVSGKAIMDGAMHRVPVLKEGTFRPGTKDGAYVGHLDGRPAGYIKNHYTGEERKWKATGQLSQLESKEISRQAKKHIAERREAIAKGYAEAAIKADQFIAEKCTLNNSHPYLEKKGITLSGDQRVLVSERGTLIVRLHDAKGKTQGFQGINPEGDKRFLKGSKKQGGMHMIGEPKGAKNILVCEGYATGQSLHQATGLPVAVAFDAGNLSVVAKAVQEAYVQASMFIMGDEDRSKDQNIGRIKAEEAARAVGGRAIFPTSTKGKSVDFNDMARSKGSAAVKMVVESGIAKGKAREDRQLEVKDSPKIGMKV